MSNDMAGFIKTRPKKLFKITARQLQLQSMIWPGILFFFVFNYLTMYGIIVAFQNYNPVTGFFHSPWVGLRYFKDLFSDDNMIMILVNTLGINLLDLLIAFPAPIIFALMLNEIKHDTFKRVSQTISYLPHFVSWIIYGGLVMSILSPNAGIVNTVLQSLGLIDDPIPFMGKPGLFWPIAVLSSLIKGLGMGSVLYLAAIASIDQEMYDAALVDGAGRIARIWHITIPSIKMTIMIMLIFAISGLINSGFDRIWIFQNPLNLSRSEVFDTYVYKVGLGRLKFSYATAIGLCRSIVSVVLLVGANAVSKKLTEESIF